MGISANQKNIFLLFASMPELTLKTLSSSSEEKLSFPLESFFFLEKSFLLDSRLN